MHATPTQLQHLQQLHHQPPTPALGRKARGRVNDVQALIDEASNPDTSPERLDTLASLDPRVGLAVAGNPGTPAATLDRLCRSNRPTVRAAIAANPNASLETLIRCISSNPSGFLSNPSLPFLSLDRPDLLNQLPLTAFAAIVQHPDTPEAAVQQLIERAIRERDSARAAYLLMRANLTKNQASRLCQHAIWSSEERELVKHVSMGGRPHPLPMPTVVGLQRPADSMMLVTSGRALLARGRPLPTELLEALLRPGQSDMRVAVASNPRTPVHVLERLESDPNPHVLVALHRNPSTPESLRLRISRVACDLASLFAGKPTLTLLAEMARHPNFEVKMAVAMHPEAPTLACDKFARGKSIVLRRLAAAHPNTPEGALLKLIDGHRWDAVDLNALRIDRQQAGLAGRVHWPASTSLVALQSLIELHERRARNGGKPACDAMGYAELVTLDGVPDGLIDRTLLAAPPQALADYASHLGAHPRLLESMYRHHGASSTHQSMLQAVAGNPATPVHVLEQLSEHPHVMVRVAAAGNASLPEARARALLHEEACFQQAVTNPCFTLAERHRLYRHNADFVHAMVQHPQHLILRWITQRGDPAMWWMRTDHTLMPCALQLLASQPGVKPGVLHGIACHANAPGELLRQLASMGQPSLDEAVAAHPSTPIDLLDDMLQRKTVRFNRVSWLAAANPSLPAERWPEVQHLLGEAWLADYQSCMFWPFMLAHPDCPERRLVRNAISSNWRHRLMVAINPSTPDETLRQLTQEGVRPVRSAARRTLAAKARALDDTTNHETTSEEITR